MSRDSELSGACFLVAYAFRTTIINAVLKRVLRGRSHGAGLSSVREAAKPAGATCCAYPRWAERQRLVARVIAGHDRPVAR